MPKIDRRTLLPVLWEKCGGICALCDQPMQPVAAKVHIDHILARAVGGTDDESNLQAVHQSCNSRKGHRPLAEAIVRIRTTPVGYHAVRPGYTTVAFHLDPLLLDRLDDYQFGNRIPSRAAAIKRLIDRGLTESRRGE